LCQARSSNIHKFSSNQKINAETPSTSEDCRTWRSGYFVVRRVQSSRRTIVARVKIVFPRKPGFEMKFGGRGLSYYNIFLV
jgi:hypothetical protein